MTEITLYHSPGTCSRVTMNALEEIGLDYAAVLVDITKGEQKSPDYLAINPKGKVPTLRVGDRFFTENAAILFHLSQQYPSARLLPPEGDEISVNQGLEDLVWCSSTLHPMTRQVRMPTRFTNVNPEGVRANGIEQYRLVLARLADRLSDGRWWYGVRWSILDVYLYWNYSTAANGGLDCLSIPAVRDHAARVRSRPAFVRTLAREQASLAHSGAPGSPEPAAAR